MRIEPTICYLCSEELSEPVDRDHVPPQQLYADEVRKQHHPNLLTIPTHCACNHSYQYDEDYFVNTLAPFALGSYSGNALLREVFRKYEANERRGLVHKVLEEFERRPSGLIIPEGLVAKRFEGSRLHRVAWKIIRGLYFRNFGEVLSERTPNHLQIVPPGQVPPKEFFALPDQPVYGQYPGVFDYKFSKFPEVKNFNYWAMLLWDRIILVMMFHDPSCTCEHCIEVKTTAPVTETA